MTLMSIRTLGDPVLRERAGDVEAFDEALRKLADAMFETMYEAPGVGLAAPQVGLSIRFFVYDAGLEDEGPGLRGAVANPVLSQMEGDALDDEGCLSVPGIHAPTARRERVRLDGQDLDGRPVTLHVEGLLARIFQHETDHTNGLLYLDRLSEDDRRGAMADLRHLELGGAPDRRPARRG